MHERSHDAEVERAFTTQAAAFEDPARNAVFTTDASWVFEALPLTAGDRVLDVAAGTGHAARQLAGRAGMVIAVDATAAMLARGQAQAAAEGVENVVFMRGDAGALPFLDGSFDAVVCRFAVHHFERPEAVISEMVRCTRRDGHVALVDLVAAGDPAIAAEQNRLERLRDPSHTRMLSGPELSALLTGRGLTVVHAQERPLERPLAPWLEQAAPAPAAVTEIEARLHAELGGGPATGFAPRVVAGDLWFTQTFGVRIGRA